MCNYEELLNVVYQYYPKNCRYMKKCYQNSMEHKRLLKKIGDINLRRTLEKKVFKIIKNVFPKNYIRKYENEEYPSIYYTILYHEGQDILDDDEELLSVLGGRRLDYDLYVSLLGNYFFTQMSETRRISPEEELKYALLEEDEIIKEEEKKKLIEGFSFYGFKKIEPQIGYRIVPNIETELFHEREATIAACLFNELWVLKC